MHSIGLEQLLTWFGGVGKEAVTFSSPSPSLRPQVCAQTLTSGPIAASAAWQQVLSVPSLKVSEAWELVQGSSCPVLSCSDRRWPARARCLHL